MIKRLSILSLLAIIASSCVNLPHSAHPLGVKTMQKPIAPAEKTKFMVPVEGGLAFYNVNETNFIDDPDMLDQINLRSYFGEAGLSFSHHLGSGNSPAALSGGLSAFTYAGRSVGPAIAETYGVSPRQNYQGTGGRFNLSFDLNYRYSDFDFCWRLVNVQLTYAVESGTYGNYRQVAIDSSEMGFFNEPFENESRVVSPNSDFLSGHYYTELIWDFENYGLNFGLGFINYYEQGDFGVWDNYMFSPSLHLGLNIDKFYARLNMGSLNPSAALFGGNSNTNILLGYRLEF